MTAEGTLPKRNRTRALRIVIAVIAVVAVFAGGWFAARAFQSPAQREAAAQAPVAVPVTATVERGNLDDVVTVSASVAAATRVERSLPGVPEGVITAVPVRTGQTLASGAVIAEVNGRPIFVLPGAFPFYRDLHEGLSGPDVTQLQAGLTAAGFTVAADGEFGPRTVTALSAFYAASGYPAASMSATTQEDTADAESAPGGGGARQIAEATRFLVVPALPASVLTVPTVGATEAEGARLVLASGAPNIEAKVPAGVAGRLSEGLGGTLRRADHEDAAVVLSHIQAPAEGSDDHTLSFRTEGTDLSADDLGDTGVVAVTIEVGARDALLVPTRAVSGRGGSDAVVRRMNGDGAISEVSVEELGTINGRTAIQVTDGQLDDGDAVVVE